MLGGAGLGLTFSGHALAAGEIPKPANVLTPHEALERLKKGNERYVNGYAKRHDFIAEREALVGGQNPYAGILGCSDSRIAPEYAFDSGRGDLFVVRVAGNFTNEDAIASFEYTVKFLGTPLLVVLGHEKCGAVDATVKAVKDGAELPGHIPYLVKRIRPAVEASLGKSGNLLANSIHENVRLNVENLKNASPILTQYVAEKKLLIVGGIYELANGNIDWLE